MSEINKDDVAPVVDMVDSTDDAVLLQQVVDAVVVADTVVTHAVDDAEPAVERRVKMIEPVSAEWWVNEHVEVQRWPFAAERLYKNKDVIREPIFQPPHNFNILTARAAVFSHLTKNNAADSWDYAVRSAFNASHNTEIFIKAVERDGSRWVQAPEHEGRKIFARQEFYENSPNAKLTGMQARVKHRNAVGLGGIFTVPQWHSGFWVTFRTPSENDLINLDRQLSEQKKKIGYWTQGVVYSSVDVFINQILFKFAMDHVVDASIENFEPDMIYGLLRTFDYYTFIWGFACTIYLDGYNLAQPCMADPTKCKHVIKSLLNIGRLAFTDTNALTPYQLRHMSNSDRAYTRDEIIKYQTEGTLADGKTYEVPVTDEYDNPPVMKVVLKSGNIQEYLDTGTEWVSRITFMINSTVGKTFNSDDERNEYIRRRALTVALRMYSHMVKRVVYEDGSFIEDREDIEAYLEDVSADVYVRDIILKHINDYINMSVVSIVALPAFKCPSCQGFNHSEHPLHPNLIPIEVNQLFFTLLDRKAKREIDKQPLA